MPKDGQTDIMKTWYPILPTEWSSSDSLNWVTWAVWKCPGSTRYSEAKPRVPFSSLPSNSYAGALGTQLWVAKFQTELGGQQSVTRQSEGEGTNTKAATRAREEERLPSGAQTEGKSREQRWKGRRWGMAIFKWLGLTRTGKKQKSSTGMENRGHTQAAHVPES